MSFEELFPQRDISCLFITQKVRMKKNTTQNQTKFEKYKTKKEAIAFSKSFFRGFPDISLKNGPDFQCFEFGTLE